MVKLAFSGSLPGLTCLLPLEMSKILGGCRTTNMQNQGLRRYVMYILVRPFRHGGSHHVFPPYLQMGES